MATALKKKAPVPLSFAFIFLLRIAAVGGLGLAMTAFLWLSRLKHTT